MVYEPQSHLSIGELLSATFTVAIKSNESYSLKLKFVTVAASRSRQKKQGIGSLIEMKPRANYE